MIISELLKSLKTNTILQDYGKIIIFTGGESVLQNTYCKQIAKVMKTNIVFADDDYLSIKKQIEHNSPLYNSGVYVIRNSTQLVSSEELFKQAKSNIASGKLLILIFDKVDKRKSFFKDNENITCEFNKMTYPQLSRIIKQRINLNENNCKILCELVNYDYGRLLLELDKIMIVKLDCDEKTGDDYSDDEIFSNLVLKENLIYQECSDTSFELIDAIITKNIKKSFELLAELKEWDDDPFKVMGLIYSYLKNILLLKSSDNINISGFIKGKLKPNLARFSVDELIKDLDVILTTEQGIKSGKIESSMALDYVLTKVLL